MQGVVNCFPEVCIPVLASSVHPAHSNSSTVLQMAEGEMMEGTKKTWTLHPPKGKNSLSLAPSLSLSLSCLYYSSIVLVDGLVADQAGIYKRLTIVQMPGDVMYLPPRRYRIVLATTCTSRFYCDFPI
eukprot:COSAG05_NODE_8541_length_694_cov_2.492437_1_plen_128_part_00